MEGALPCCGVYVRPLPGLGALPAPAQGGRLLDRPDVLPLLEGLFELPKPFGAWPRSVELPCAFHTRELFPFTDGGRLCESWFCRALLFPEYVPACPADRLLVFIVWTGMCDAPAPGAVRATTDRFSTELGGRLTLPRALPAPKVLCFVGETPALFVTRALRNDDSSR